MRQLFGMIAALAAVNALASQPGQPLDCSDWEPAISGISCHELNPGPCLSSLDPPTLATGCQIGNPSAIDVDGYAYSLRVVEIPEYVGCPGSCVCHLTGDAEVWRHQGAIDQLVGRFRGRCGSAATGTIDRLLWSNPSNAKDSPRMLFDSARGALQVPVFSWCDAQNGNAERSCVYGVYFGYNNKGLTHVIELQGLTTLFDVLQSFAPSGGLLSFRRPLMPDGFPSADRFDTYWGTVSQPIDMGTAHPLQCSYPSTAPHAGDFLTFPDAAPNPPPGGAVFYITSVTHQGQIRAGRKATNGKLSGRDATKLPPCALD